MPAWSVGRCSRALEKRILILDADVAVRQQIAALLNGYGLRTIGAGSAREMDHILRETQVNLVLLDLVLPDASGLSVCTRLLSLPSPPAIMVVSEAGDECDVVVGLEIGADDYVVKPFSLPELLARVKAILRRASPDRMADVLKSADIELDRAAHRVTRGLRQVRLGPTEFRLLEFLMESPGRVLSRTQLLDGVWGRDAFVDERTVDVHIGRLRKALIRGNERDPIRTVRSAGYVFGDA